MDEQNKTPDEPQQEKKLSRKTLTFYIIGLFSVAIALILISYVAQSRADKQLDTLESQLSEQQTVAQGVTQKMEDLQKQFDALQQELADIDTALAADPVVAGQQQSAAVAVNRLAARADALSKLSAAQAALLNGDYEAARQAMDALAQGYTEPMLLRKAGSEATWVFTEQEAAQYTEVKAQLEYDESDETTENEE